MMTPYFKFILLLVFLTTGLTATATHGVGADLTYKCLGNNQYEFVLTFYRDCNGVSAPATPTINIASATCNQSLTETLNYTGTLINNAPVGEDISPLCPSQIVNSTCNGGTIQGIEQYTYSVVYTLPAICSDWTISYELCCRNGAITNSTNPEDYNLYVETTLDNSVCNNSPVFVAAPIPYICIGQAFSYNHGAVDAENDSLVYSLIEPRSTSTATIPYAPLSIFSATYPISTDPINSFNLDASSGNLNFTPSGLQVGIVVVLVEEYRNGVLIGSTMRDMQVVVENCNNQSVSISGASNVSSNVDQSGNTFSLCLGNSIAFDLAASDPDMTNVITVASDLQNLPGATLTETGTNPRMLSFNWTPTEAGIYPLIITYSDDACPIQNIYVESYIIEVNGLKAFADETLDCTGTLQSIPLRTELNNNSQNGTYFWSPSSGLSDPTSSNPTAQINQPITYTVTYTDALCTSSTEVSIVYNPDSSILTASAQEALFCPGINQSIQLSVEHNGNPVLGSYLWTPSTGLDDPGSATPIATINSPITYTVSYNGICPSTETVSIDAIYSLDFVEDSINLCSGDSIALELAYTGFSAEIFCDAEPSKTCNSNPAVYQIGTGTTSSQTPTPYDGFWHDGRVQILYLASELQTAGVQPGLITSLAFEVSTKGTTIPFNNFTIKLGCTNASALSTAFIGGLTQVMSTTHTTIVGWNTHTFDTPYSWDGTSNIIVEVCFDNIAYTDEDLIYATTTSFTSVLGDISDNASGCTINTPTTSTIRPNIRFGNCTTTSATNFSWTPSSSLTASNGLDPMAFPTSNTTYTVVAIDNNCALSTQIEVYVRELTIPNLTINNVSCKNGLDGSVVVSAANGFPPYSYELNNSNLLTRDSVFSNLSAGAYTATVYDENGCTYTTSFVITEPNQLVSNTSIASTCLNVCDGGLVVNIAGGTSPYDIAWSTGAMGSTLSDLCEGSYSHTVTDQLGCTTTETLFVPIITVSVDLGTDPTICSNESVTIDAGAGFNSYAWSDGSTGRYLTTNQAGTYFATVVDVNNCETTDLINVNVNQVGTINMGSVTMMAEGDTITLGGNPTMSGGASPYIYSWTPVSSLNSSTLANPYAFPLETTTYYLTTLDLNGCFVDDSLTIFVLDELCGRDFYEPNDSRSSATSFFSNIGSGTFRNTYLCPQGDVDWFSFETTPNKKSVTIQLDNLPADYNIEVYTASNVFIGQSSNLGTQAELIQYNNLSVGTYYVRVYGNNDSWNATQSYSLFLYQSNSSIGGGTKNPVTIPYYPVTPALPTVPNTPKAPFTDLFSFKKGLVNDVMVYPNPNDGVFEVLLPRKEEIMSLRVMNALGQVVYTQENVALQQSLDLKHLDTGIYFLDVQIGTEQYTKRVVISK